MSRQLFLSFYSFSVIDEEEASRRQRKRRWGDAVSTGSLERSFTDMTLWVEGRE